MSQSFVIFIFIGADWSPIQPPQKKKKPRRILRFESSDSEEYETSKTEWTSDAAYHYEMKKERVS